MNLEGFDPGEDGLAPHEAMLVEDRWILDRVARIAVEITDDLDAFRFADATRKLRDLVWSDFCDWYLELVKARLRDADSKPLAQRVLATVLDLLCRLLHPIMPFVTEQIWQALNQVAPRRGLVPRDAEESVCIAAWPVGALAENQIDLRSLPSDAEAEATIAQWQEKITTIRNLKAERNLPKDAQVAPIIIADGEVAHRLRRGESYIRALSNAASVQIVAAAERPSECAVAVLSDAEIVLPLEGLIDKKAEAAKQRKALADLEKQLNAVRGKLGNEGFIARAPADVIAQQRAKEAELVSQMGAIETLLAGMGSK
jgi:valyl-tRNA synthetase